jgi:hypothetical protein
MPVAVAAKSSPELLNSWKEIASYLDRGVRTVQRWEHELRLPVHRIGRGKRSPVYASIPEIKFWLVTSGVSLDAKDSDIPRKPLAAVHPMQPSDGKRRSSPLQVSHELVEKSRELVHSVAAATIHQRQQAEILQKHILKMRSRIR